MADSLEEVSKPVQVWVCDHGHAMPARGLSIGRTWCNFLLPPTLMPELGARVVARAMCSRPTWVVRLRHPAARAALLLGGAQAAYDLERQLDLEAK